MKEEAEEGGRVAFRQGNRPTMLLLLLLLLLLLAGVAVCCCLALQELLNNQSGVQTAHSARFTALLCIPNRMDC